MLSRLAVKKICVTDLDVARGSTLMHSLLKYPESLIILLETEHLSENLTKLQSLVTWSSCGIQSLQHGKQRYLLRILGL